MNRLRKTGVKEVPFRYFTDGKCLKNSSTGGPTSKSSEGISRTVKMVHISLSKSPLSELLSFKIEEKQTFEESPRRLGEVQSVHPFVEGSVIPHGGSRV